VLSSVIGREQEMARVAARRPELIDAPREREAAPHGATKTRLDSLLDAAVAAM
jgi:hypothetical protein